VARHGRHRLGPAVVGLGSDGRRAALAAEALEVALGSTEARLVVPLLAPHLRPAERLARISPPGMAAVEPLDAEGWLRDLVEDPEDQWRSGWLRACAVRAARGRGVLDGIDITAARNVGDPVIDEELGLAAAPA
jgi:hypothetical protein